MYGLNMQFDRVRVGAIAFATDIIDRFYMNTYQNKEGVINALNFYNKVRKFNLMKIANCINQLQGLNVFPPIKTILWFYVSNPYGFFCTQGGHTDTGRALRLARDEFFSSNRGDRSGVNNVIILVSDGFSTEGSVQSKFWF